MIPKLQSRRRPAVQVDDGRGGPVCFGPFIGEFAYEFMYAGVARRLSQWYNHVVVVTRPDRVAFHEDYADEIIPHDIQCVGMDCRATRETAPMPDLLKQYVPDGHYWIRPSDYAHDYLSHGDYIVYGQKIPNFGKAIILHARERAYCSDRNWERANWDKLGRFLREQFPDCRLLCIGSKAEAHAIEGSTDLRGIPVKGLMNLMRSAWVYIGQSSGPAHLASHCKLPHVIWCEPGIEALYQRDWNPHSTWVRTRCFPGDPHKPSFDMVREFVMASLAELRSEAS